MSAQKARGIHSMNSHDETVILTVNGVIQSIPVGWNALTKVELIALAKRAKVQFVGRPPMHFSRLELLQAIRQACRFTSTAEPQVATTTTAPTVSGPVVAPVATKVAPSVGGLDSIVTGIVTDAVNTALSEYEAAIDADKVRRIVDDSVSETFTGFRHEVTNMIANVAPQVRHITIAQRPTVKLHGKQHARFDDIVKAVGIGEHVYMVGAAGTGKSTIAENVAQALGLSFASKSVTAQTSEASLVGFTDASGKTVRTPFREVFEHGGVFLLDEVDNGNPNVLNVLNSALANGVMAFPDGMVRRHEGFVAMAAANTFGNGATAEYVGRNPIDKAFLDRFAMVPVDLDTDLEQHMLNSVGLDEATAKRWYTAVLGARRNVAEHGLRVIVSPRATVSGAKLILAGLSMADAMEMRVLKGATADQREKILAGITL
jgi:hypothetical protein